ncbi:MAG: head GIN domain-containing protein [Myxococcota bacterium]
MSHLAFFLAVLFPTLAACSGPAGSGVAKTETRAVGAFDRIEVGGALQVDITVGAAAEVKVTAEDNLVDRIEADVVDGELVLKTTGDFRAQIAPRVIVTVPTLDGVEARGASRVDASGLEAEALTIEAHGASRVEVDGTASRLDVAAHGASRVDATDLASAEVAVEASGASEIDVARPQTLVARLSGASRCTYAGEPRIDKTTSGASTLAPR